MAFGGDGPAIGIDLGTTYSCVGVWQHNRVEIIPNDQGNRITPSYVSFTDTDRLVGDAALNEAASNPTNTVFSVKRLIGRRFSEASVKDDMKLWPFVVTECSGNKPKILVRYRREEKQFTPEEISAMVLMKMKQVAESYLGCTVKNAVVTVPAYFNDAQRQATKDAGRIAGLNVMRIMDEPTAGAVAYGFDKNGHHSRVSKTVLVFDLGGDTFDVSLLKIKDGVFEVKATAGDTHLGGEDFDNRLLKHLIDEFRRKHGKCISHNARALRRLKAACERAKRVLSTATLTDVNVECLYDGIDFKATVTRARFEDLNLELFKRCIDTVKKCLQDARVEKTQIDDVVLIGGSTRIPMVQKILRNYFEGKELCKNIHPDEAVAYGAALQAAKLSGQHNADIQSLVLVDVTPFSLGTDIYDGLVAVLIPRNTPIPAKKEEIFHTCKDFQTSVPINVYEGERARTDDNNFLGGFNLCGISRAPRGQTKVKVCFEIDADGILSVSAKDLANGEKKEMTITRNVGRLSEEEIQRMVRDAERYRVEDEEYRKKVFAKKALDDYVYKISTVMKQTEVTRKLPQSYRKLIMGKLRKLANFLESKEILEANVYKHKLLNLKLQWNGTCARNYEGFTNDNAEMNDFPELDKLAICSSTFLNSEYSEEDEV